MLVIIYYSILNILTILLYGIDKLKAKLKLQRIPEKVLLRLSIFGGVYGALLGMILFNHKTNKLIFKKTNYSSLVIHSVFIYIIWRNI